MNLLCKSISIGGHVLLEKEAQLYHNALTIVFSFHQQMTRKIISKIRHFQGNLLCNLLITDRTYEMTTSLKSKTKQKNPIKPHKHVSFAVRDEFLEIPRGYNLSARMWHTDASWNFSKKAYCVSKPLFNIIGFNVETQLGF